MWPWNVGTGLEKPASPRVSSPLFEKTVRISRAGSHFSASFVLPPGELLVTLSSDGPLLEAPEIRAERYFGIENLALKPEETPVCADR